MSPEQIDWLIRVGRDLLSTAVPPESVPPESSPPKQSTTDSQFKLPPLAVQLASPRSFAAKMWNTRGLKDWQIALLRQQVELRWRSRQRFPNPNQWLWTDRSLSQASDHWSARFKAALFPPNEMVVDACCGAGADLVALAERGEVLGIDSDASLSNLAQDNALAHGYRVEVRAAHLPAAWRVEAPWLSIDPDRRTANRSTGDIARRGAVQGKTLEAQQFSPTVEEVLHMAQSCAGAVIKLAPATRFSEQLEELVDQTCQRIWLGNLGECRQQLLLTGDLRPSSGRGAVLCEPQQGDTQTVRGQCETSSFYADANGSHLPTTDQLRAFIFDLHPTLHAAGLQVAWAQQHGLTPLASPHGYFTGETYQRSPWSQGFEVLDVLAWDDRKIRKSLRNHGAGIVEVKSRSLYPLSMKLDTNACQRRYSRPDGQPLVLLVTRIGRNLKCIIGRRTTESFCGV